MGCSLESIPSLDFCWRRAHKKKRLFIRDATRELGKAHSAAPRKLIHLLGNHLRIFIAAKHGRERRWLAYFLFSLDSSVCARTGKLWRRSFAAAGVGRQDTGCD
jgi:hypothetical protein